MESHLSTDTADYNNFADTEQDCRAREPEFEVAAESRPEELKPLAKASVIWEEECGAKSFSCDLIHTSLPYLSRSVVSLRRQRAYQGDLGPCKKFAFSQSGTVDDSYCCRRGGRYGGRQPPGALRRRLLRVPYEGGGQTCRTREADSLN